MIHPTAIVYPGVRLGAGVTVGPYAIVGNRDGTPVVIGEGSSIGNYALVRGRVTAGDRLKLGSYSSIEGDVTLGDDVTIRGRCEIPNSVIGDRVQVYAGTMFYDTPNPPHGPNLPPVIEDDVVLCCDVAVLGGVTVGAGSFVSAQAFVKRDVPPGSYVKGNGECVPLRP